MNKILKWVLIGIGSLIILFFLLALLVYFPPFQRWAVRQVAAYASEKTGSEITIESVNLEFPLDLGISGFKMIQRNKAFPQVKDTVADVEKVVADIQFMPLFKGKVEINELDFSNVKVNTSDFVAEAKVRGMIGKLSLVSHGIDLNKQTLRINDAKISNAKLDVLLIDTVPADTSTTENLWKIYADKFDVSNTNITVHLPGDTITAQTYFGKLVANDGFFDLNEGVYSVKKVTWSAGKLKYDNKFEGIAKGLDYNHIALSDVNIDVDSLYYHDPELRLTLKTCSFREKSGLKVAEFSSKISMDSTSLYMPVIRFRTPESSLTANLTFDLNTFADRNPGKMQLVVHGSFGKQDLRNLMGGMPLQQWPNYPLSINGVIKGNIERINFTGVNVKLPTAFNFNANGYVANPLDMKHIKANIDVKANTYNLAFVPKMLPNPSAMSMVKIPSGIALDGKFKINGSKYDADFVAKEGGGSVKAKAMIDVNDMSYDAELVADNLQIQHFMPNNGLHPFTGYIDAKGKGFDFLSAKTTLNATASVEKFMYGDYQLDNIDATAIVKNGLAHANIDSRNELVEGLIMLDATLNSKKTQAKIECNLDKADLYNLKLVSRPLIVALQANTSLASNFEDFYYMNGGINNIMIEGQKHSYRPENMAMDVITNADTTHAVVDCGDFHLNMNAKGGYEQLGKEGNNFFNELQRQLKEKYIDQTLLRNCLPTANVNLATGKNNLFVRILNRLGYSFNNLAMNVTSSPALGLNGNIEVDNFAMDSLQIDTIRLGLLSHEKDMTYKAQVHNIDKDPKYAFNALLNGGIYSKSARMEAKIYDGKNKLGISLGLAGAVMDKGIAVRMYGDEAILGYKKFGFNKDNYLFLGNNKRVYGNLALIADDGTGVQIASDNENKEALQDLTFSINQFDLGNILSIIPYAPAISGTLNGDFHIIQTDAEMSVSSDLTINNMVYEKSYMGNISSEFSYIPRDNGAHSVMGIISCDDVQVADFRGTYNPERDDRIAAKLILSDTPLRFINGFIPDQIVGLKGYGRGELTVRGTLDKPEVNGELYADSAYLVSVPYGVSLRFDTTPIQITGSNLIFKDFKMFSPNNSTLNVSGNYDFSDLNNMNMNLTLRANDYQIIDSKENNRSETFGKAFVNFYGTMRGPVNNLQMRGMLDVLGSTDMTYILRDSPLTNDNQLEDLVIFTNFQSPNKELVTRPTIEGFGMDLTMNIDDNAHIMCALSADKTNYIDITGGGNLRMIYNNTDNLRLTGRYTLSEGEMKYALPIIPLKTFTIQDGSYLEFTGDVMNPRLNITATQQTKAMVNESGSGSRSVTFDCGVILTRTLNDMGLQFTLDAPQDMAMHDELQTMSIEEQGKLAVTMLTTGMYLASGNTSKFSMNTALSSFLQNQINTISGNALRTLDLSVGLDNTTDPDGTKHTDYSFKFAKRFWNNRLNIIIGGKMSSGGSSPTQNNSFLDNVSLEYRLSDTSNQYLRLFYDHDTYDWLEGYIGEYGAGFMWKRKVQTFRDIFRFNDSAPKPALKAKKDTTKVIGNENEN